MTLPHLCAGSVTVLFITVTCCLSAAASLVPLPGYAGTPYDVTTTDSDILVSTDSGLAVFGPAGSASPVLKGFCKLDGWGYALAVHEHLVYVGAANDRTMNLVDITDPGTPFRQDTVSSHLGGVWGITLRHTGSRPVAALATTAGAAFYDLSDPVSPLLLSTYSPYETGPVMSATTPDSVFFNSFSFSLDTSTVLRFPTAADCGGGFMERNIRRKTDAVSVQGDFAALLYYDETRCGAGIYLKSLDISDPAAVHCIDSLPLLTVGCALAWMDTLLFAGHHFGLDMITVHPSGTFDNPHELINRLSIEGIGAMNGLVFITGNPLYADITANGECVILDLRTQESPDTISRTTLQGRVAGLCVDGTMVYAAGERGLHCIPFSPPDVASSSPRPPSPRTRRLPNRPRTEKEILYSLTGRRYGPKTRFSGDEPPEGCYILSIIGNDGTRFFTRTVHLKH